MNQELQVISPGAALPISLYGKKHGGVIGQQLHVFALNSPPNQVRHIAVSRTGEITHNAVVLPDAIPLSCSVQPDHALLVAQRPSIGQWMLAKIAANGVVEWERGLGVQHDSVASPKVFVLNGVITLFWIAQGEPPTIQLSTLQHSNLSSSAGLPLPNLTFNLRVTPLAADLIVTRLAGVSLTPQMLRIRGGQITQQVTPQDIATGGEIYVLGLRQGLAALWQNHAGDTVYWQWLNDSFKPRSSPNAIYTTEAAIRSFRAYVKSDETVLIQVLVNQPSGRMVSVGTTARGERYQQAEELAQQLFLTDGQSSTQPETLRLQGSPYFAGGWLDDRLYLLHGEQQVILSVLALS